MGTLGAVWGQGAVGSKGCFGDEGTRWGWDNGGGGGAGVTGLGTPPDCPLPAVDDVQVSCYRILCSIYSLGTTRNPYVER